MFYIVVLTAGYISIVTAIVPLSDLYPYGNAAGDVAMAKNDDSSSPVIPISVLFPFFDHQHDELIVNTNGAISFLSTLNQFTPSPFPLDADRRLITAYWGDVDTREGGTVWYRETTDLNILRKASEEIRQYKPKFVRFQASWALIATWDNVAFYGCSGVGCSKRNTFQTILLTNGRHSFVIFMYNEIVWTTGTASNGNATTGLGGTPAQVGFNAGDGKIFFAVNASRTPNIVNINYMSNVGVPGKFIFRVDSAEIEEGGCNSKGSLTITPRYGPMLGGQLLTIGGPCVDAADKIKIIYGQYSTNAQEYHCERRNNFSVTCVTPMFMMTGDITVTLRIKRSPSNTFEEFHGIYTILNPAVTVPKIKRHNVDEWINQRSYSISWDQTEMELGTGPLQIEIFSLQMIENKFHWTSIIVGTITSKHVEETRLTFTSNSHITAIKLSNINNSNTSDMYPPCGIWSDIFPSIPESPQESSRICQTFIRNERSEKPVPDSTQPCPCTIQQAVLDNARYNFDPECNRITGLHNTRNCIYRESATHCVRLSIARSGVGDNLCCYDRRGRLIDSRNKEGGFIQRYHYLGGPDNVPYLSNMYYDTVPFLHCCRYSHKTRDIDQGHSQLYSMCQPFFEVRKPNTCHNYRPPRPARTSGDPHITTLDGLNYTFNGVGEFQLLQDINKTLSVQIRFEQYKDNDGNPMQASVTTAIAMTILNTSDTVEVRLNPIRIADVFVNGQQIEIEDDELSYLQFKGVSVFYSTDYNQTRGRPRREIIVTFPEQQFAISVHATQAVMNVMPVIANPSWKGHMRGLLGNFDENPYNDLRSKQGRVINESASTRTIYNDFGTTWRITEDESLFTYPPGQSYNTMQNSSFTPVFDLTIPENVSTFCGGNIDCAFDLQLTQSTEFVEDTLVFTDSFDTAILTSYDEIQTCMTLPEFANGSWTSSNGQIQGSTATSRCNPGYYAKNVIEITCINGLWTPYSNFQNLCEDIRTAASNPSSTRSPNRPDTLTEIKQLDKKINVIWATMGAGIALIFVCMFVFICTICCQRRTSKSSESKQPNPDWNRRLSGHHDVMGRHVNAWHGNPYTNPSYVDDPDDRHVDYRTNGYDRQCGKNYVAHYPHTDDRHVDYRTNGYDRQCGKNYVSHYSHTDDRHVDYRTNDYDRQCGKNYVSHYPHTDDRHVDYRTNDYDRQCGKSHVAHTGATGTGYNFRSQYRRDAQY